MPTQSRRRKFYSKGDGPLKVLITGGYGFIGSHVAEYFFKEGYDVHILDDLSSGKKENIQFSHTFHHLSIDDAFCGEVFSYHSFHTVVHLAAQVSVAKSIENPLKDAQLNIVGLLNILQLAKTYGVKKFIFASSAAIYGNNVNIPLEETEQPNPISPYGLSKWIGEQYCTFESHASELETVCLRFSNVYGPRQTDEGEGGVISIFTSQILKNETLQVHGDGNQTRDFIYVEDVAAAIYRAAHSPVYGVFNLSTNTEESIRDILRYLEKFHGEKINYTFTKPREGDIYRSSLQNKRIGEILGWLPRYKLEEGLKKTYAWAKGGQQNINQANSI